MQFSRSYHFWRTVNHSHQHHRNHRQLKLQLPYYNTPSLAATSSPGLLRLLNVCMAETYTPTTHSSVLPVCEPAYCAHRQRCVCVGIFPSACGFCVCVCAMRVLAAPLGWSIAGRVNTLQCEHYGLRQRKGYACL